MLIVPVTGKISWNNPPIITLSLIIINCVVFFFCQHNDNQKYYSAKEFYFRSGLAKIEVPRYIEYLNTQTTNKGVSALHTPEKIDQESMIVYSNKMEEDFRFIEKLQNDEIITIEDEAYPRWKALRKNYDDRLSKVVFMRFGFKPAYRDPVTFVTHMFLHGSFFHLLSNMVFLWIVGCMLEIGRGKLVFCSIYLVGGLLSVLVFWLVNMESVIPLVGASGAISGIMGGYAVLFGRRKIKIFYSLGFYFNYLKIPAIVLLPVWLVNEFYQLFSDKGSHIAYVAHIGGLGGGALLGFASSRFLGELDEEIFQKQQVDELSILQEKALECISHLDMEGGRRFLEKILSKDPRNINALTHLFNIEKQNPESPQFHEVTRKLLFLLSRNSDCQEIAYDTYEEYTRLTKHARLPVELYLRMVSIICTMGYPEKAQRIVTSLMKKKPDLPGIATSLLKLANTYRERGVHHKYKICLHMICSRYPDSQEAQIIRESFDGKIVT